MKLNSIELLHANGDTTIIEKDAILDLVIEDVTENWELNDKGGISKSKSCGSLELAILYNTNDDDVDVIHNLQKQTDLVGFVLYHKKNKKKKEFELPYLMESEEDYNNIFQFVNDIDMNEIADEVIEEGDRILAITVAIENLEIEEEGVD